MVPGVGEWADLASGLLYLTEGDYLGTGLSLAAAVPYKEDFKALGLDIEDCVIMLPQGRHNRKPNGIHTGKDHWNRRWDEFLGGGNEMSPERVLDHLEVLRNEFGI